ncbi:MAG: hypothetical protein IJE09_02260 [Oscillospiraceae bacterium]|nr:hypothetical protein [Oscillospiraceae bacterium]
MRNGKHVAKRTGSKMLVTALALILVCCMAVGGTMAWLMDSTDEVVNTFTSSGIDIDLVESESSLDDEDGSALTNSYQMIPGWTITKDPKVTVLANSEDCYLFVEIIKENNFDTFMTYAMADGWKEVEGQSGVYYREVGKNETEAQPFYVLKGTEVKDDEGNVIGEANQLTVKDGITKENMKDLTAATYPKMSVKAYAIQLYKTNGVKFTAAEAWAEINPTP